jgi:hypothetical protein
MPFQYAPITRYDLEALTEAQRFLSHDFCTSIPLASRQRGNAVPDTALSPPQSTKLLEMVEPRKNTRAPTLGRTLCIISKRRQFPTGRGFVRW